MGTTPTFQPHKHRRDIKGRFARQDRPEPPVAGLVPCTEQVIDAWVDRAHPYTTVEPNGEPEGFVAVCPPAPGAFAFAETEQEALDDMRSVLIGWAHFSLADGQELPRLPSRAAIF